MWYAKMYFYGKLERFEYDAAGVQGAPSVYRDYPFLESLLTFQEMDCSELTPSIQRIADLWEKLVAEDDRQAGTDAMVELGKLKVRHIYLELLYVRWYERFTRMGIYKDRGSEEDQKMLEELRQLPDQLPLYQKQVQRFLIWFWMWTAREEIRRSRHLQNTFTIFPRIVLCFAFIPFPLTSSQWRQGGVRRFCTPPAFWI